MIRAVCGCLVVVAAIVAAPVTPVRAQNAEVEHIRGRITSVSASSMVVQTRAGKSVRIGFADDLSVFSLTRASFVDVAFGTYVGSVAMRMDDYPPAVRDSRSWLYRAVELRIIDESLRGIALGHRKWDLPAGSAVSHGWVDDIEARILSIKYGPTDDDETDVEVPLDAPVHRMSLGDRNLIVPRAHVVVGVQRRYDGKWVAAFICVGKDGVVPPL